MSEPAIPIVARSVPTLAEQEAGQVDSPVLDRTDRTQPSAIHLRVVITGTGFAGFNAASGLANTDVDVLLLDRNNYHVPVRRAGWTTLTETTPITGRSALESLTMPAQGARQ